MRLLECDHEGNFSLTRDLVGNNIPAYAILSHTWGPDTEEVTFKDLIDDTGKSKAGYNKIRFCAEQAERDGLRYFWVDTCCIDKSNNNELSEAINSMFRWYRDAARCYVYLSDITITSHEQNDEQSKFLWVSAFRASRWFTRGWTLQELLAPVAVEFFTREGQRLGDKRSLEQQIQEITGIAIPALRGEPLSQFKVDERLKWAETRLTTREEDWAYCLLGIFGVFMPLIYGEGRENAIRRLRKEIDETLIREGTSDRQGEKLPQPFAAIPFCRDPDFVDRGDILHQIKQRCSETAARVALVGLGGVGKSQLAIEFAHRVVQEATGTWVFWVHAGTQARVEEGFRTIADMVELPDRNQSKADIPKLVYSWLSNERNGRWVMILDSADDSDVFYSASEGAPDGRALATYLPQSRNGSIILTTRDKDLAFRLTGDYKYIIEVGPMIQGDALLLLEKKLGSLSDMDVASELVRALDLIPLAISQAAAYIRAMAPRSSPEKYLAEFRDGERKRAELLRRDAGDLRRDQGASNAILTTWQISFDHIRSKRPSAADLLSFMSFFDRQGIPESLIKSLKDIKDETRLISSAEWVDSESDGSDSESHAGFEDDIMMLRDYCLITTNEGGDEFEMHGLVQLSTRKWLEAYGLQDKFKQQYIAQMATSFPEGDYSNWATCQKLFAHAVVAADYRPAEGILESWAALLCNGGQYALSQGRYGIAEQMIRKARRACEKKWGKEHEATLKYTSLFALVLLDEGRFGEAEKLFVQVMETGKTKLGLDHPNTLTDMGNLASTYRNQGRWKEAEKLEVHVMETLKIKLGSYHSKTLISMGNLASTYRCQGRWEEAEKLEIQVMEIIKTKLGEDHPDTLTSMANLALTYRSQGRWEEAEKLDMQVMETRKTKLGEDHPDTLLSMGNLAVVWKSRGRHADALVLMKNCARARHRVLGPEHPYTVSSLNAVKRWSS